MKKEYDFSKAQRNPYAKRLKRQVTIRLDQGTVMYFKDLAAEAGIPYQTLINLYLRDCATSNRRLAFSWPAGGGSAPNHALQRTVRTSRPLQRTQGARRAARR